MIGSNRGMTLIETMVGLVIAGVVLSAVVSAQMIGMKGQNLVHAKAESINFHDELRQHLSSGRACLATFGGIAVSPTMKRAVSLIKDAGGATKFQARIPYANNSLEIDSMSLDGFQAIPGEPNQGFTTLNVHYRAIKEVNGPSHFQQHSVNLIVATNGTVITECIAQAKMTDGIWRYAGPSSAPGRTPWDIFYTGGNIGMGTAEPDALLHIEKEDNTVQLKIVNRSSTAPRSPGLVVLNYGGADGKGASSLFLKSGRGSAAAPQRSRLNDPLGFLGSSGHDGTEFGDVLSGSILFAAGEDQSPTARGTYIRFDTTANGEAVPQERMRISPEGVLNLKKAMNMARLSSAPYACGSQHAGDLVLSSKFRMCVCTGSAWVETSDGASACGW